MKPRFRRLVELYKKANYRIGLPLGTYPRRTRYRTGSETSAQKFGKSFIETFKLVPLQGQRGRKFTIAGGKMCSEAATTISLKTEDRKSSRQIATVGIGFEKDAVIIEMVQGGLRSQSDLDRFRALQGKPWANDLIERIENHAKERGFRQVKIRVPESLYYYHYPAFATKAEAVEIRERMEKFYSSFADAMEYERKTRFFVKTIN